MTSTLFKAMAKGEGESHELRKVARAQWMDLGIDYLAAGMLLNHAMNDLDATFVHTTAAGMMSQLVGDLAPSPRPARV
ncbi:hypothetical protein [Pseudomonas fluorescens]|uniref:hypothetical protein n=1 Tax=Pseudomonas fluorescens TaxID=294 RepID=UPI00123EE6CD|nr:hypothetical protein [Pseudomonas fluorescens]